MKNTIVCFFVLMHTISVSMWAEENGVHRFGTFNVRYTGLNSGDIGDKNWMARREAVAKIVSDYDFDVIGMEEVTGSVREYNTGRTQLEDLQFMLKDYDSWAVERNGKHYEHNVIFFKRSRYEKVDCGKFYLNEHPETPGPGWAVGKNVLPRVLGWVRLKDKQTGREFMFAATHTNYGAIESGRQACKLIGERLDSIAGNLPVVLVGDFNMRRNDHAEAYMGCASHFKDAALLVKTTCLPRGNIRHTASNWQPADSPDCRGSEFDYVFFKGLTPLSRHIITEDYGRGIAPSDHFPLLVRFKFE